MAVLKMVAGGQADKHSVCKQCFWHPQLSAAESESVGSSDNGIQRNVLLLINCIHSICWEERIDSF
jgi:hypothetical protein